MQTCNISRKCTSRARSIVQKTYLEHTLRPYMVASLRVVRHHIRRSPPDFDRPCRYSHAAFVFVLCHMSQSNHSISSSHPRCILEPILKYCIFSFPHQSSRSEKLKDAMKKKLFPKDTFPQKMHFRLKKMPTPKFPEFLKNFSGGWKNQNQITRFTWFVAWLRFDIVSRALRTARRSTGTGARTSAFTVTWLTTLSPFTPLCPAFY